MATFTGFDLVKLALRLFRQAVPLLGPDTEQVQAILDGLRTLAPTFFPEPARNHLWKRLRSEARSYLGNAEAADGFLAWLQETWGFFGSINAALELEPLPWSKVPRKLLRQDRVGMLLFNAAAQMARAKYARSADELTDVTYDAVPNKKKPEVLKILDRDLLETGGKKQTHLDSQLQRVVVYSIANHMRTLRGGRRPGYTTPYKGKGIKRSAGADVRFIRAALGWTWFPGAAVSEASIVNWMKREVAHTVNVI